MTVNATNRAHVAYGILLLVVGVLLATALVIDGERNAGSPKGNTFQINRNTTVPARLEARISACMEA